MPEMMVSNPQESQWWKSRLLWLMENEPKRTLEMWNSPNHERLLYHLDVMAVRAMNVADTLREIPNDVKLEMIAEEICPPIEEFPDDPMPEATEIEILNWAERLIEAAAQNPEGRTVTISAP